MGSFCSSLMALSLALAAILALAAVEEQRLSAPDAEQGVASDGRFVYAVSNHIVTRIDPATGRELARWDGDPVRFKHINSCTADGRDLICAASNYPSVPMQSIVERFDLKTLQHRSSRPIDAAPGSLTWAVRRRGAWWACFANYDGKGGTPGRDHRFTTLVRYDRAWREKGRWRFPDSVLARMAPKSASGGDWGEDGLLYVTGHDRRELYALRVPRHGETLVHVATIAMPTGGQAIAWDAGQPRRLWSIDRAERQIVASRIPAISQR